MSKTDEPLWYVTQVLEREQGALKTELRNLEERWTPDTPPHLEERLKHLLAQIEIALEQWRVDEMEEREVTRLRSALSAAKERLKEIANSVCSGESLMYNGDGLEAIQLKNCCENIRLGILHRLATEAANPQGDKPIQRSER